MCQRGVAGRRDRQRAEAVVGICQRDVARCRRDVRLAGVDRGGLIDRAAGVEREVAPARVDASAGEGDAVVGRGQEDATAEGRHCERRRCNVQRGTRSADICARGGKTEIGAGHRGVGVALDRRRGNADVAAGGVRAEHQAVADLGPVGRRDAAGQRDITQCMQTDRAAVGAAIADLRVTVDASERDACRADIGGAAKAADGDIALRVLASDQHDAAIVAVMARIEEVRRIQRVAVPAGDDVYGAAAGVLYGGQNSDRAGGQDAEIVAAAIEESVAEPDLRAWIGEAEGDIAAREVAEQATAVAGDRPGADRDVAAEWRRNRAVALRIGIGIADDVVAGAESHGLARDHGDVAADGLFVETDIADSRQRVRAGRRQRDVAVRAVACRHRHGAGQRASEIGVLLVADAGGSGALARRQIDAAIVRSDGDVGAAIAGEERADEGKGFTSRAARRTRRQRDIADRRDIDGAADGAAGLDARIAPVLRNERERSARLDQQCARRLALQRVSLRIERSGDVADVDKTADAGERDVACRDEREIAGDDPGAEISDPRLRIRGRAGKEGRGVDYDIAA